jgi:hypothetical protein
MDQHSELRMLKHFHFIHCTTSAARQSWKPLASMLIDMIVRSTKHVNKQNKKFGSIFAGAHYIILCGILMLMLLTTQDWRGRALLQGITAEAVSMRLWFTDQRRQL